MTIESEKIYNSQWFYVINKNKDSEEVLFSADSEWLCYAFIVGMLSKNPGIS